MSLRDRWKALPRAAKFGTIGVAGIAAYFLIGEPALDAWNRFSTRADQDQAVLEKFALAEADLKRAGETLRLGSKQYGKVEFPGDPEARPLAFNRAVDEILRKHNVRGQTSTTRTVGLGPGALTTKVGQDNRVDRLTRALEFQGEPEQIAAVLADLEKHPLVTAVSMVHVRSSDARQEGRNLTASLTVETWMLAKKGARGR
jgi:hypothetical protein